MLARFTCSENVLCLHPEAREGLFSSPDSDSVERCLRTRADPISLVLDFDLIYIFDIGPGGILFRTEP
uniref:Uncharacterized protein n=1 Tax=Picea glauca TaxID=3330 RepID=A0A117NFI1_PICGL|nr:hypothetical protein ABT39_MTgene3498 [Picea glauca]QHR91958.1 hypothetical protein Q903MT_gene5994 [Picea sitchensis]